MSLVITFAGWCLIRLATDPDPADEPRGVSGFTFAFAGEPPLDRIVRFQPPDDPDAIRSHGPPEGLGVKVKGAVRTETDASVAALIGAKVDLIDKPKLENRNWTLTLPGKEPIVPFKLRITKDELRIARDAPLDPAHPNRPLWEATDDALAAQGANGIYSEPETVGHATGIWDSVKVIQERLALLEAARETETNEIKRTALDGRIRELKFALENTEDRRVVARYAVERFAFPMTGRRGEIKDPGCALGGKLDTTADWQVAFWMGAWDPDLLSAWVQGSLQIPYAAGSPPRPGASGDS